MVAKQTIEDAPYITLREDEITPFERVKDFGVRYTYECKKCGERIYGAEDYIQCPFCGRKVVRIDE